MNLNDLLKQLDNILRKIKQHSNMMIKQQLQFQFQISLKQREIIIQKKRIFAQEKHQNKQNNMQNSFFTPQQIQCRKKQPYKLSLMESYDFTLLNQDLFQLVSPHVESISDQKRKIISWLKRTPLLQRTDILTFTSKQLVCLIRSMYDKKQASYYDASSTTFTISYIEMTYMFYINNIRDEFDLLVMVNNKKLSKEYYDAEDELLENMRVMSRYTQFDSLTFSEEFVRNVDVIFNLFDVLGDGIAHELTVKDFERLNKSPNSYMFYDPTQEHCYKKARIGTWITQVFMKHISMKYLQHTLDNPISCDQLKQRRKQFQKYWKLITPERKNEIIKKVLLLKPIDLYQQHRSMIKVTRNGFPPIQKSDNIPQLIKSILTSSQKDIFDVLFYSNLNQTLQSHSILKYYITLELEDQIKRFYELQNILAKDNKMKKKKKKTKNNNKNSQYMAVADEEKQPLLGNKHIQQITNCNDHIITTQTIKQQTSTSYSKTSPSQSTNQEKVNLSEGEMSTKGNDLFYKKLEVSQTIQIISFQSSITNTKQVQRNQSVKKQDSVAMEVKEEGKQTKKKRKNKKKNQNKIVGEQRMKNEQQDQIENINNAASISSLPKKYSAQSSHLPQLPTTTPTNQPLTITTITDTLTLQKTTHSQSSQTQKFHHMDKISQKSSQTTNDYSEQLKLQSSDNDQEKQVRESYNNWMGDLMRQLEKKMSFYNKQRRIILNRLAYVFAQHQLSFKLYGSSSTNTSLPSSDIDIVVDPSIVNYFYFSYSNYRHKVINSLEYLQKVLEKHDWASEFTLRPGATIPLLTFTADPSVEFQPQHGTLYNNKKQLKQQVKIYVDVTIQTYVNMTDQIPLHLGVESSQLVKQWIACFPFYNDLLILVKIFTKNHNLNKTYHGGISSFMHAVLLATFFKRFFCSLSNTSNQQIDTKKQTLVEMLPTGFHLTQMFIEYCKFIIQFNEQKQIIDVNSNLSTCLKPPHIPSQQLTIINPLTGNVISERCTSFPVYKKLIQQLYGVLTTKKQVQIKQYIQIVFDE